MLRELLVRCRAGLGRRPANVFVLCTGRCGSVTFAKACEHITNYTSGHETRVHLAGSERVAYPSGHIEADNRLAWFLGDLDGRFGADAFYVWLQRDVDAVARSFQKRWGRGIIEAFAHQVLFRRKWTEEEQLDVCRHYVHTVNRNIEFFLRDKPLHMRIDIESATASFAVFWRRIRAEGDLTAAVRELQSRYNATPEQA